MATWKTYRITEAVKDINEGKFVLPVIQRRLVWDEEKMELLFDTLLKGDSFGGIMVIEEEKESKPLFSFRNFTKDGSNLQSCEKLQLDKSQYFVIDGQQRLQSFFIGLFGTMNGKNLYFDLFSNYKSEYEFKFSKDENTLPLSSKDERRTTSDCCWYSVKKLLEELKKSNNDRIVAKQIIKGHSINDELKEELIEINVSSFYRNIISGETLGLSLVTVDKNEDEIINRQRIVELFRRLNDGGTRLSGFDLVASMLKGFDWKMEEYIDITLKEFSDIELDQDNLVKTIFLLQNNSKKEMAEITAQDASFAVDNRDRITSCFRAVRKFLQHSSLYSYYKEGGKSFIPLYFIAYHLFHRKNTNQQIEGYFNNFDTGNVDYPLIKKWLYLSIINGIFRSRGSGWIPSRTGINKILNIMSRNKGNDFPYLEIIQMYKEHPLVFTDNITEDNLNTLDFSFVFYLIYDKTQTIRIQDIDHIHSKSKLELIGYNEEIINNIFNYQLLDYGTNRGEKNNLQLKYWIENFVQDREAYLNKHLIPDDEMLWIEKNYDAFLTARKKLVMDKIHSNGI
jgi:hypothetical protein